MNVRQLALVVAPLLLALAAVAQATDPAAGKAKATEVCAACHGADGNSPSPDFRSSPASIAIPRREDYRQPAKANHGGFAKALTKQDIDNPPPTMRQPAVLSAKY
jgi:mono/diheme cytochrome c family protein